MGPHLYLRGNMVDHEYIVKAGFFTEVDGLGDNPEHPYIHTQVYYTSDHRRIESSFGYTATNHCPNGWYNAWRIGFDIDNPSTLELISAAADIGNEYRHLIPDAVALATKVMRGVRAMRDVGMM